MKNEEVTFETFEIYDKTILFCWIFKDSNLYYGLILTARVIFLSQFNFYRVVILNREFEILFFRFHQEIR